MGLRGSYRRWHVKGGSFAVRRHQTRPPGCYGALGGRSHISDTVRARGKRLGHSSADEEANGRLAAAAATSHAVSDVIQTKALLKTPGYQRRAFIPLLFAAPKRLRRLAASGDMSQLWLLLYWHRITASRRCVTVGRVQNCHFSGSVSYRRGPSAARPCVRSAATAGSTRTGIPGLTAFADGTQPRV